MLDRAYLQAYCHCRLLSESRICSFFGKNPTGKGKEKSVEDPKGSPASEQATPEGILQLGLGFWGSKELLSAVEIGLFTELAKGSLDFETLSERLMLHPRSARDSLDALVALGMLERDGDHYANTPETDLFLDRAKPSLRWRLA